MKKFNWHVFGRVVYAYLVTVSTLVLFSFMVKFMRGYIYLMNTVLQQPEEFFTNKMLFLLIFLFAAGGIAIYCLTMFMVSLGTEAWELLSNLVNPWSCQYGGRVCEVGKKNIDSPKIFCARHFMERLEVLRVTTEQAKTERRK